MIACWLVICVLVSTVGGQHQILSLSNELVEEFFFDYVAYLLKDFFVVQFVATQLGLVLGCFELVNGELL
eukprot:COSAG02_NODE_1094_length_14603_cov_40.760549_6_plen_70_part_00